MLKLAKLATSFKLLPLSFLFFLFFFFYKMPQRMAKTKQHLYNKIISSS